MMDTQCSEILETTQVVCRNEGIADLEGLQYFTAMEDLQANQNNLTSFPPLPIPNSIVAIDLRSNDIQTITYLPESVYHLKLSYNENLSDISYFPNSLEYLEINSCTSLFDLPDLPQPNMTSFSRDDTPQLPLQVLSTTLNHYYVSGCGLTEIPDLPDFLMTLDISDNELGNQETLLDISDFLTRLNINNTGMSVLPELPSTLTTLQVAMNQISELPPLPENLETLDIYENPIMVLNLPTSIVNLWAFDCELEQINPNYLPNCVQYLVSLNNLSEANKCSEEVVFYAIESNNVSCLEWLPEIAQGIYAGDNPFTCIPSLPEYDVSDLKLNSFPICVSDDPINNPFGCEPTIGFEGYVYLDQDQNCDYNETQLANIPLKLGSDGLGFGITSSVENGRYTHQNEFGNYEIDLDFQNAPFINNCGNQELTLDGENPYYTDLNFALICEFENDFGVQSVIPNGWVFPGQPHETVISAGELSQFYNANCSGSSSGEVLITMSGPAVILGTSEGSATPSNLSDSEVTYEIEDFTSIDLMDHFKLDIYTLTTATDEDEICFTVQVISSSDDPQPENDYLTFCYPVVNSYDPNNKLVSPMTVEPGYNGWLYYTVNFQNTGSAPAFNIRLEDELPQNVDLETFQMTNSSHESNFDLIDHDLTVYYPNIMLADSTSNEPESKGYFQFKIHTLEPLELGETVENTAAIYFDFNDPIITNTAVTLAETADNISELNTDLTIKIYPNPAKENVTIQSDKNITDIQCKDLLGKEVEFESSIKGSKTELTFLHVKGTILISIINDKGVHTSRVVLN